MSTRSCFALVVALATLAFAFGCGDDEAGSAAELSTEGPTESVVSTEPEPVPVETVEKLTDPVAQTRAAILAAGMSSRGRGIPLKVPHRTPTVNLRPTLRWELVHAPVVPNNE